MNAQESRRQLRTSHRKPPHRLREGHIKVLESLCVTKYILARERREQRLAHHWPESPVPRAVIMHVVDGAVK